MKFGVVAIFTILALSFNVLADSEKLSSMRSQKKGDLHAPKIYLCFAFGLPGSGGFETSIRGLGATGFEFPYFIAARTAQEAVLESDSKLRNYIVRNPSTLSNMILSNNYEVDCRQQSGASLASTLGSRSTAYAESIIDKNESKCRVLVIPTNPLSSPRKNSVHVLTLFLHNNTSTLSDEDQTELYPTGASGNAYPAVSQSLPSSAISGQPRLNNSNIKISGLEPDKFHTSSINIQWQTLAPRRGHEEFREATGAKVIFGTSEIRTAGVFLSSECINQ